MTSHTGHAALRVVSIKSTSGLCLLVNDKPAQLTLDGVRVLDSTLRFELLASRKATLLANFYFVALTTESFTSLLRELMQQTSTRGSGKPAVVGAGNPI